MLVHRRFQLLRRDQAMLATEPTRTISIRVPESLHKLLKRRSREMGVSQNSLVLEGLKTRLTGDRKDASQSDHRKGHPPSRTR
jgi:hypothetical protein